MIGLAEGMVERHAADGGGHAWLESSRSVDPTRPSSEWRRNDSSEPRPRLAASSFHRFEIGFEVGPMGIDEGGTLFLNPEAFWYWSNAQTQDRRAPGYTTARARSDDVELRATGMGAGFRVVGRGLRAGERIDFVYGAGESGARVDRYAERGSEIMIAVDANGDGFREWIDDAVRIDVIGRPGSRLLAFGPAEIAPGEPFEILVSLTDGLGNRTSWPETIQDPSGASVGHFAVHRLAQSSLELENPATRLEAVSSRFAPMRLPLTPTPGTGTIRLRIEGLDALEGLAFDLPPIVVRAAENRLVWGDLHGHTRLSDGTGTPKDYFAYARDIARLDVIALTDHDHWGPRPLDERPDLVAEQLETVQSFNEPGRFITIPGYEWTNWLHGHRHVLYFEGAAPIFSALDPETDRPDELWDALRSYAALTFAHHSAGEPVATNWSFAPDPELEPLTEIVSIHGSSEAGDAPWPVRNGIPGNFVRDTLMRGARLGFIGSGDSHDGHPGLAQFTAGQGGLAGIFTPTLDRSSLLGALRRRHTFATNGIRPWLEVHIDDTVMGGTLDLRLGQSDPDGSGDPVLRIHYEATAPIEGIDLIRSGRVASLPAPEGLTYRLEREIPPLASGEFHYVRIRQRDGGVAWSSPIFID
ncbi:MAG: hypothetical protein CL933_04785 [Deltaproteobacteria bacterium]|nr:hypothetical protein [Deltaproteobacteria bacterium]